jgi:hypothetical protein
MASLKTAGWGAFIPDTKATTSLTQQVHNVSQQIKKIPKVQLQFVESLQSLNGHIEQIGGKIDPPAIRDLSPSALAVIQTLNLARTALSDSKGASTLSTNKQLAMRMATANYKLIASQLEKVAPDLHAQFVEQFVALPAGVDFEHARRSRIAKLIEFERKVARTLLA